MSEIKYRGKKEFYFGDSVNGTIINEGPYTGKYFRTTYLDCLYFATDSREILMNGQPYDGDIYDTSLDDDLEIPNDVGGILKGATASDLRGKTYTELFDDLLFPTILPTISPTDAPIFTLPQQLKEVGYSLSTLVDDTFTPTYDAGTIMLNGVEQGKYAGEWTWIDGSYESVIQASINIAIGEDGYYELNLNNATYKCNAKYKLSAGENIPKDNKGNTNAENSQIPAQYSGKTDTVTGIIITTAPVYATTNTSSPTTVVKQSLRNHTILSNRTYTLTVAAHNPDSYPTIIKVPGTINAFYETDAGGNFVEDTLDKFTVTTETINNVTYNVYKQNDDGGGSRTIKFTFTND